MIEVSVVVVPYLLSFRGKERNKTEFVTKFVGIIITTTPIKFFTQIAFEIFATKWFFSDLLKQKNVKKKTTYQMAPASPNQM